MPPEPVTSTGDSVQQGTRPDYSRGYYCDTCGPVAGFCGLHRCEAQPSTAITPRKVSEWCASYVRFARLHEIMGEQGCGTAACRDMDGENCECGRRFKAEMEAANA